MKTMWLISLCIAAADQAVKSLVRSYPVGDVLLRLDPFVEICHRVNTGAAFSLFSGRAAALGGLSIALLAAVALLMLRPDRLTRAGQTALACLLGGGVGNMIDRLCYGGVTDYIRLLPVPFPVFNLADTAITLSVAAMIVLLMKGRLEKTTGERHGSNH